MIKRLTTKIQHFLSKRKEIKCRIIQVKNTDNYDQRIDLIIEMYNAGFRKQAISTAKQIGFEAIETKRKYDYNDLKKDLNYILTACTLVILGFIIVNLLT